MPLVNPLTDLKFKIIVFFFFLWLWKPTEILGSPLFENINNAKKAKKVSVSQGSQE